MPGVVASAVAIAFAVAVAAAFVFAASVAALAYWRLFNPRNRAVEFLKNALLSHALMKVGVVEDGPDIFSYHKFDGSKLPSLSGCSTSNACFTYIQEESEMRRSPWFTQHMLNKKRAIDKYLEKNLTTDDEVVKFFEAYLEQQTSPQKAEDDVAEAHALSQGTTCPRSTQAADSRSEKAED